MSPEDTSGYKGGAPEETSGLGRPTPPMSRAISPPAKCSHGIIAKPDKDNFCLLVFLKPDKNNVFILVGVMVFVFHKCTHKRYACSILLLAPIIRQVALAEGAPERNVSVPHRDFGTSSQQAGQQESLSWLRLIVTSSKRTELSQSRM